MFVTYLMRELRRRMRQSIFIALGLALGVGLVITVMAASNGVSATQGTVLKSLYGVGTDVTVTQPPAAGSGGGQRFNFQGTDSGTKGTNVNRDILTSTGLAAIKSSAVTTVSDQKDVTAAVGSLTLNDLDLSGTFSQSSGSSGSGGSGGSGGAGGQGGGGSAAGSLSTSSFSVSGVDPSNDSLGPLSSGTITSGHSITTAEANDNVAVVDSNYAKQESLKTGSTITVAGKSFTVVGIVQAAQGVTDQDVYIPLARAQSLASMPSEVNTIYVSAASASDINAVSSEISKALPSATVTTSSDLANEVTGSLSSASTLANNLGKWLAVAVLLAAFLMASILTMSAVTRRVREFGTLKAIGWNSGRIIRQIMGESLVTGLIGGIVGVGIGYGAAAIVQAVAPPLTATTSTGASQGSAAGGGAGHAAASAVHTVSVHLTAPVTLDAVGLAVVLAIVGGLVAGMVGGWRAVRLRPAAALSRLA
ncbi:MAG TPA: ABC transporter permease [Trebonia sp.]|jgi:putative ABC transport system permease protein|nr:ABC transporter permease [Trebonia sp.]